MFRVPMFIAATLIALEVNAAPLAPLDQSVLRSVGVGPRVTSVTFGGQSAVPIGYYNLCKTNNSVCRVVGSRGLIDGRMPLTPQRVAELVAVNAQINRAIRPSTDQAAFGVADHWVVSPHTGDCEDYVLTKKKRLMSLGWPSSALLIALATTDQGVAHAVLIVRTTHGDLVLDNLSGRVKPWSRGAYRWDSIQSPNSQWTWYRFGRGEVRPAPIGENTRRIAQR